MATHSSALAWRILWTEEPGGLQSTGSQNRTRLSAQCSPADSQPPLHASPLKAGGVRSVAHSILYDVLHV